MKNFFVVLIFVLEFLVLSISNEFKIVSDFGLIIIFFIISFVLSGCYIHYDYLFKKNSINLLSLRQIEIIFSIMLFLCYSR